MFARYWRYFLFQVVLCVYKRTPHRTEVFMNPPTVSPMSLISAGKAQWIIHDVGRRLIHPSFHSSIHPSSHLNECEPFSLYHWRDKYDWICWLKERLQRAEGEAQFNILNITTVTKFTNLQQFLTTDSKCTHCGLFLCFVPYKRLLCLLPLCLNAILFSFYFGHLNVTGHLFSLACRHYILFKSCYCITFYGSSQCVFSTVL